MDRLRVALIPLFALALAHAAFAEQHEGGMPHHPMSRMMESMHPGEGLQHGEQSGSAAREQQQ